VCLNGACVQCTAEKSTACGAESASGTAYVCDSIKHTCTTQVASSAGLCDACVSDAQCAPGELCVLDTLETPNGTKSVGYFCHWKQGGGASGAPADCKTGGRPYAGVRSVASIDGETADVCVLRSSSCVANGNFSNKDCAPGGTPDDGLCGVASPSDAKCVPYGAGYRCTMTCLGNDDCRGISSCLTSVSPNVCAL
jgi:hypothetical protein